MRLLVALLPRILLDGFDTRDVLLLDNFGDVEEDIDEALPEMLAELEVDLDFGFDVLEDVGVLFDPLRLVVFVDIAI
tara:strand:- start:258 stop:488 length:231 start_codon:yes stop_codon:yes gene_type:complete